MELVNTEIAAVQPIWAANVDSGLTVCVKIKLV